MILITLNTFWGDFILQKDSQPVSGVAHIPTPHRKPAGLPFEASSGTSPGRPFHNQAALS